MFLLLLKKFCNNSLFGKSLIETEEILYGKKFNSFTYLSFNKLNLSVHTSILNRFISLFFFPIINASVEPSPEEAPISKIFVISLQVCNNFIIIL